MGTVPVGQEQTGTVPNGFSPVAPLSPRQAEILQSIIRGLSNPDIAKQLGISLDMVKEYTEALFQKLGVANRPEAVAIALRKHLLKI